MTAADFLNMGADMARRGKLREAEAAFIEAIILKPDYAQAFCNLGYVLYRVGRLTEAEACLLKSIMLEPDYADAYNNLSLLLMDTGRLAEAEECLVKACELNASSPVYYNNLGLVLEENGRADEAEALFRRAIGLNANYADAQYNLGNLLKHAGKLAAAELCYQQALGARPDFSSARFALSTLYLLAGQFEKGWKSYNELRMHKGCGRKSSAPCWQGEDLTGRSILLFHEQGFGDTIQFVRYAAKVAEMAANTTILVQKPLKGLIAGSFPLLKVYSGEAVKKVHYDYECALPNLPMLFKAREDTICNLPYLKAATKTVRKWHAALKEADGGARYRVGLVWAGNPKHHNDGKRSIPLEMFSQLLTTANVSWVSLQVGPHSCAAAGLQLPMLDFSGDIVDFAETAGLIANLDLVISVDSAVAHLAGALGKETWVLLPYAPDWRWQLGREDSPWYSSVRLFRQEKAGAWPEVLQRVKQMLARKQEAKAR